MSLPKASGRKTLKAKSVGGIPVVRGARNRYRDMKRGKVLYMTYVMTFPDGDQWTKQEQFSSYDMEHKLKEMITEHRRTRSEWAQRAMALYRAGECWWKDEAGMEHLMMIEETKRETRWGITKEDYATFQHGVTGEELT